jgi:hypothetical protein
VSGGRDQQSRARVAHLAAGSEARRPHMPRITRGLKKLADCELNRAGYRLRTIKAVATTAWQDLRPIRRLDLRQSYRRPFSAARQSVLSFTVSQPALYTTPATPRNGKRD